MGFVPDFENDIFISYAHNDNLPVGSIRWVERLHEDLENRLTQLLGRRPAIWRDKRLDSNDLVNEQLDVRISTTAVLLAIVSPSYFASQWCGWEREKFLESANRRIGLSIEHKSRITKVVKTYVDFNEMPLELRETLGSGFVREDRSSGRHIEMKPGSAEFEEKFEELAQSLANLLRSLKEGLTPSPNHTPVMHDTECPYLGLEAFTEDKHHLFFGRDNFIAAIEQKLRERQFIAVVGPSGSGKSSVVQAGVFPRLGGEWRKLVFQPGDDPFLNLADKFIELRGTRFSQFTARTKAVEAVAQQIRDNRSIAFTVAEMLAASPQPSRLLLVADQFEELFTLTPTADRRPFVEALLAASQLEELKVLVTLRADFFGQAISLTPELSQWLQDGVVTHRPLQRADWEAVILNPAKSVGLNIDPALVTLILEETETQPDSLPLLEYALKELWQRREQGRIGLAQYEAIGKLAGAINQRADAVLAQLPEGQQALALRALTRLVRVSGGEEEGADTRLRLPMDEMTAEQREVLQCFVQERLLVTNRNDRTGEQTIEVAHEALIRQWQKLQEALDSDREFLVWRRRLNMRRNLWEQKMRDDKWLLAGGEHEDAQHWLNERRDELSQIEIEFITWVDRPDFQIERILAEVPNLLLFSEDEIQQDWFITLVFCGEQEKALWIAREIADEATRAEALGSIAEALPKARLTAGAREFEVEVLAAAHEIADANARAEALDSIAEALADAGLIAKAREVKAEALAAAREIADANARASALGEIAKTLADAGLTAEGLAAAREIADEATRAEALGSIAEALADAGLAADGLAAAREIADATARAWALSEIAKALADAGLTPDAREVDAEALAAVREIADTDIRAVALGSIAKALADVGLTAEAREVETEALAAAREITNANVRSRALSEIAKALADAGLTAQALSAVREIADTDIRAVALGSIAKALADAGLTAEAREVETEALAAAREITNANARARALSSLAKSLAEAGLIAKGLAAAREIANADTRADALCEIAEVLVKAGLTAEALAAASEIADANARASALGEIAKALADAGLTAQALAAAREIADTDIRARALGSIAEALVDAGLTAEAREVETEALAAAREIGDATARAWALMSVADFWLELGQVAEVESLLEEIRSAVCKIYSKLRTSVERELSGILARLHRYSEARTYVEQCDRGDKLAAYTTIFREYYIERDPSLAQFFTEDEEEGDVSLRIYPRHRPTPREKPLPRPRLLQ